MRIFFSFAIGCVLGAAGILIYLQETHQLAIAATIAPAAATIPPMVPGVKRTAPSSSPPGTITTTITFPAGSGIAIPVQGIRPSDLRNTFGELRGGTRQHQAIDILAPRGTPVVSAVAGQVRKLFNSRAGGLTVYVIDGEETKMYYYAHLDRYAPGLQEGKRVAQGEVIGYVGTTGNASPQTPHLHFAINILPPTKEWWKGDPIDPYPILVARGFTVKP